MRADRATEAQRRSTILQAMGRYEEAVELLQITNARVVTLQQLAARYLQDVTNSHILI